eukprot:758190-Hanusia_phi.AAC.2
MLLEGRFEHLDLWCEYLEKRRRQTVNEDFSNIDLDNSAWPVVIDEVEFDMAALVAVPRLLT